MREYSFVFPVQEVTYKVIAERKLNLYMFEPRSPAKDRTAILFFIGGSFGKGPRTPADFQYHAEYLSSKGIVAICVDYRNGYDPDFTCLIT